MIVADLVHFERYVNIHPKFKHVAAFLKSNDLGDLPLGRISIEGDDVFVNINQYMTSLNRRVECHQKYIDIQILLHGEEKMGWALKQEGIVYGAYDEGKDIAFCECVTCKYNMRPEMFFVFFPEDLHQPGMQLELPIQVKKAVFKVKVEGV